MMVALLVAKTDEKEVEMKGDERVETKAALWEEKKVE